MPGPEATQPTLFDDPSSPETKRFAPGSDPENPPLTLFDEQLPLGTSAEPTLFATPVEHTPTEALTPNLDRPRFMRLRGLLRVVTGSRAHAQEELRDLTRSQAALRQPADLMTRRAKFNAGSSPEATKYKETFEPKAESRPQTRSEWRQARKAGRTKTKANKIRADRQYRLKQVYGGDIGTDAFVDRIKSSSVPRLQKRRSIKAHKEYKANDARADQYDAKVRRMARGQNRRGDLVQREIDKKTREAEGNTYRQRTIRGTRNYVRPLPGYVRDDFREGVDRAKRTYDWLQSKREDRSERASRGVLTRQRAYQAAKRGAFERSARVYAATRKRPNA